MLKYVLLGFLNYQPMTGYELERHIQSSTANFWHAKLSQIYTTLKTLEQAGFVVSEMESQEGRPDRRIYTITEAGRNDLLQWLAQPLVELETVKSTFLLKLFFARPIGKQAILTHLRLHYDLHQQQLKTYREIHTKTAGQILLDHPVLANDAVLWNLVRRFGELRELMYLEWLQEAIDVVEQQLPGDSA